MRSSVRTSTPPSLKLSHRIAIKIDPWTDSQAPHCWHEPPFDAGAASCCAGSAMYCVCTKDKRPYCTFPRWDRSHLPEEIHGRGRCRRRGWGARCGAIAATNWAWNRDAGNERALTDVVACRNAVEHALLEPRVVKPARTVVRGTFKCYLTRESRDSSYQLG